MLNYNLNIIEPLKQDKKGRLSKPVIVWGFEERTQTPLGDLDVVLANASMSIFASASNCLGVSEDETNFFFSAPEAQVSASLQGAGVWPTTGSVTMSLLSAGTKPNSTTLFYTASYYASAASGNLDQSGSIIRNNFTSPIGYDWVITGSIIARKGNESNSKINWIESGSTESEDNCTFRIVKNANEVLVPNIFMTSSQSGSFFNDYAFNITASISGAKDWEYSASFQALTMSISIPEIGFYVTSSHTASIITGSFVADVFINPYNITASLELEPYPSYSLDEFVFIGKGGNGGDDSGQASGGGGGAGAVISGSGMWVYANSIYWVNVGGSPNSIDNGTTFYSGSNYYIKALDGGNGAKTYNAGPGASGGSGGGSTGGNPNDFYNSWRGGLSSPSIWTGSVDLTITGSKGGAGLNYSPNVPIPTYFGLSGGGGGATSAGQDASSNRALIAQGGTGVSNLLITSITGQTGSFSTGGEGNIGPEGSVPGVPNPNGTPNGKNALTYGSGGGGAQGTNAGTAVGGSGYPGIAIIKYLGPQRGRGGVYSFDGTYSYHTFTTSSYYWSTAAMSPKKH